jgi:hypothetical protein
MRVAPPFGRADLGLVGTPRRELSGSRPTPAVCFRVECGQDLLVPELR